MTTDLETYRLRSKSEQALCINSDYWRCPGLYLSSVCMAVHLKPKEIWSAPESMDKYKEDLRTLLRGLAQRLLEHNLWRPLVAVIEMGEGEYPRQLALLGKDQEWHRGDFLLFIEKNGQGIEECIEKRIEKRIADLLEPGEKLPMLQRETTSPHNPEWFREELDKRSANSPFGDLLQPLLECALPRPSRGRTLASAKEGDIRAGFKKWAERRVLEAQDIAQDGRLK